MTLWQGLKLLYWKLSGQPIALSQAQTMDNFIEELKEIYDLEWVE